MRILLFCFIWPVLASAQSTTELSIGILERYHPSLVQVIPEAGIYTVQVSEQAICAVHPGERVSFQLQSGQVVVRINQAVVARHSEVRLISAADSAVFRLFVLQPRQAQYVYDDQLYLRAEGASLELVNRVALEKYVAGVVEAESGKLQSEEFYKAQAIISRTYALNNLRRHWRDGFNLNDEVSSQVYHGKARWEPRIISAVDATRGQVLVDSDMKLITAAFHSNSGGHTVGSEDVWSAALPYLSARRDEFSLTGPHYSWFRVVSRQDWLKHLHQQYGLPTHQSLMAARASSYRQPQRATTFLDPEYRIPLSDLRSHWQLPSTWFDIYPQGSDSLCIEGRGFGHGIGLSQEGAMRMAFIGFTFEDILHFYYDDVHIIDLQALDFFRTY